MTKLLRAQNAAFKSQDKDALRSTRTNLNLGMSSQVCLWSENPITPHRHKRPQSPVARHPISHQLQANTPTIRGQQRLPQLTNTFFSQFGRNNTTTPTKAPHYSDNATLHLDQADLCKTLLKVNPRKAAGPGNMPGHVLRDCADSLTTVVMDIFNISLS